MKKRYIALAPAILFFTDMIIRDKQYCKNWLEWSKYNKNSLFTKFLVLIRFIGSPTMVHEGLYIPKKTFKSFYLNKLKEMFKKDKKYNVMDIIEKQLTEMALERSKQFADDLEAMTNIQFVDLINDKFVDLINDKRDLINEVQGEVYDE